MAEFSTELLAWLKTRSGITSLVGSSTGARIFPERPKQNAALPYLIVTQSSGSPVMHLGGRSVMETQQYEVLAVGGTRAAADQLARAVFAELTPSNKQMGTAFVAEIVTDLFGDAGDDLPQDGSDTARYWKRAVYRFFVIN